MVLRNKLSCSKFAFASLVHVSELVQIIPDLDAKSFSFTCLFSSQNWLIRFFLYLSQNKGSINA